MDRRKFLVGMGSLAAGGAAALGTGAFSSVSADRTVSVNVADDSSALLALDARNDNANAAYADESGDAISVNFADGSGDLGSGINKNAVTKIYDIFTIENQGTRDAVVYADPQTLKNQNAFDQSADGIYFDPQFSDMPNNGDSALGTLPDGTKYGSLTGIGSSVDDFETDLFASNSKVPFGPDTFTLSPGESFDFGVYLKADDTVSAGTTVDYTVELVASAQLAEKADQQSP